MNGTNTPELVCNKMAQLLNLIRLPAMLTVDQTAALLGMVPKHIPILVAARHLKPLGKPARNGGKWFAAVDIEALAKDRDWLEKARRIISDYFRGRNSGDEPPGLN